MTNTEVILSAIVYVLFLATVYEKQFEAKPNRELSIFLALIWPVTLTWYIIKAVFFEDWK